MEFAQQLSRLKTWQRARVDALQEILEEIGRDIATGTPVRKACECCRSRKMGS